MSYKQIDEQVEKWYKTQLGTAGDNQKLKNLLHSIVDQATSKAREEEHKICKRVYIDHVDWSEWGIDDEEASENFENEYQEELKLKKELEKQ